MSWNVDVSQYLFAIGNCGGPIALTNHSKSSTATSQQVFTNTVQTFSATGQRLATMQWNKGLIVQLFWSSKCNLVVVVEDGIIYTYDAWGEFISSFSLEKTLKTQKILECKGQEDVLVFLSTDLKFYRVTNLADPRPQKMAVITTMKSPPSSWCIVNPKVPDDSRLKILVASKNRVYIVDDLNFLLQPYESRTYTHIAISPSGKLVALLSSDGAFSVTTLDFKKNLSKTFTDIAYPPSQLAWCGVDSVVACWDNLLVMMGPAGTWTTFSYESQHVIVNTEMDGLRIFSATSHDFLQKVPEVSVQALLPDSNRPAALLLKAYKFFKEKNCKADELIRQVRKDLKEAVQNCVEAARSEFDISIQKQLLKAAIFGKSFLENFQSEMLVEVCKCLKIMNTLRSRQASFPLSYFQYKELTPTALLDKLLQRRQHSLAHGICVYLGLNSNAVLLHWACAKAARGIDDECTCESILARTEESKGIPYATIANTALLHGRPRLATRLLNYETRAGEQVPLLLALSENELALTKAVESGDTDLVYLTILQLNKKLSLGDFFQIIREKQVACNLLIQYYKSHDKELLKDLYYQNDQKMELTFLRLQELSHHASTENYQANVTAVIKQLNEARDALFYKRALEGQLQLRKVQKKLDSASNELVGLPLAETVFRLLLQGEEAKASKLKSTFKMTNKKFWWLKIRSLGAKFYWTELEKFSLAKKSPIGYEPFAEECMARGAFEEAVKYILKCPVSTQVTFYCNLGRFDEAIECAVRNKSIRDLELVEEVARRNPHVLEKVEKAKVSLSR